MEPGLTISVVIVEGLLVESLTVFVLVVFYYTCRVAEYEENVFFSTFDDSSPQLEISVLKSSGYCGKVLRIWILGSYEILGFSLRCPSYGVGALVSFYVLASLIWKRCCASGLVL